MSVIEEKNFSIFNQPPELKRFSEMVLVEGGAFIMGAIENDNDALDREKPPHNVTLNPFHIGKFPVTQALWEYLLGENKNKSNFIGADRPVERVSWNTIKDEFLPTLNEMTKKSRPDGYEYCLLTEAQWEYAARGGKHCKKYNFKYAGSNKLNEVG